MVSSCPTESLRVLLVPGFWWSQWSHRVSAGLYTDPTESLLVSGGPIESLLVSGSLCWSHRVSTGLW